jgi:hypothetical protein
MIMSDYLFNRNPGINPDRAAKAGAARSGKDDSTTILRPVEGVMLNGTWLVESLGR